jgi:hypothetical protein
MTAGSANGLEFDTLGDSNSLFAWLREVAALKQAA